MSLQARVSLGCAAIGAFFIAGFLLIETTALDGLLRVAALVVYGDAS